MAFIICGMHLDREVHTTGDLSDPVQQGIGSYLQTPRNQGEGSGKAPKILTKTRFPTEPATKQGISSQQQE